MSSSKVQEAIYRAAVEREIRVREAARVALGLAPLGELGPMVCWGCEINAALGLSRDGLPVCAVCSTVGPDVE